MSNRFGAFDGDLRQRRAVGLFDPELFLYGRFDKEIIEGAVWSVALVGFADADSFGADQIAAVLHATGALDGDTFGAETSAMRIAASGLADVDSFGVEIAAFTVHGSGATDADAFGVGRIIVAGVETGVSDPDAYGALIASQRLLASGFLDADVFGTALLRLITSESAGIVDPDAFGLLLVSPVGRLSGLNDDDAFGLAVVRLTTNGGGYLDDDRFGLLIYPHKSPRRRSRLHPNVGDVAKPRSVIRFDGHATRVHEVVVIGEPSDVQERNGSFLVQDLGLVTKKSVAIFFDLGSLVEVGDHYITDGTTYLVSEIATKAKQLVATAERLITQ